MDLQGIAAIANSQNVLALLAVVVVVGFGLFIDRRVWPWFTVASEKWRSDQVELQKSELLARGENNARWYRMADTMNREFQSVSVQLAIIREGVVAIPANLAGLREQIDDMERYCFENGDPATPEKT